MLGLLATMHAIFVYNTKKKPIPEHLKNKPKHGSKEVKKIETHSHTSRDRESSYVYKNDDVEESAKLKTKNITKPTQSNQSNNKKTSNAKPMIHTQTKREQKKMPNEGTHT